MSPLEEVACLNTAIGQQFEALKALDPESPDYDRLLFAIKVNCDRRLDLLGLKITKLKRTLKTYSCACCGTSIESDKPQDPERDLGYGVCETCKPRYAEDAVKCGFAGRQFATYAEALARFQKYA